MEKQIKNVSWIRDNSLCMGCGSCVAVCPINGAISLELDQNYGEYLPVVHKSICTDCTMCVLACPGYSVNFDELNEEFIDGSSNDDLIGKYIRSYLGHSLSSETRLNSSSGGLVTEVLVYALENKLIDGALVLGMSPEDPTETFPYIARTSEEIRKAAGSKYCPSAINLGLKEIIQSKGVFAVVGKPCDLHSVRKIELIKPSLRKKIKYHFGLFCANNNTIWGTKYFLENNKINPNKVKDIKYRWGKWPGKIRIVLEDGEERIIARGTSEKSSKRKALFSSAFHYDFSLRRCLVCVDQSAELSDVSFADPWLKEFKEKNEDGQSVMLIRTFVGDELINGFLKSKRIMAEDFPIQKLKKAQNYGFKKSAIGRIHVLKWFGKVVPNYGKPKLSSSIKDRISILYYLPVYFSRKRYWWPIIRLNAILRTYYRKFLDKFIGLISIVFAKNLVEEKLSGSTNILLYSARLAKNFGGPSIFLSIKSLLSYYIPNAKFNLMTNFSEDSELAGLYNLNGNHFLRPNYKTFLSACIQAFLHTNIDLPQGTIKLLNLYRSSDAIIDIWGIVFTDAFGSNHVISRMSNGLHLLLGKLLRKKVIKYTADFGPLNQYWNKFFTRFYLNHAVDFIMVRSNESKILLEKIKINKPIDKYPDTAFLLEPESSVLSEEYQKNSNPPIGISISFQAGKQLGNLERYKKMMTKFIDHIIDTTKRKVIIIPNEINKNPQSDDKTLSIEVFELLENKDMALVLTDDYPAPKIKGLLKICDVIVSSRYHTVVAGLSLGIPVFAIGWHHKYEGILSLFNLEKYSFILDFKDEASLLNSFSKFWEERDINRKAIRDYLPDVLSKIYEGGEKASAIILSNN